VEHAKHIAAPALLTFEQALASLVLGLREKYTAAGWTVCWSIDRHWTVLTATAKGTAWRKSAVPSNVTLTFDPAPLRSDCVNSEIRDSSKSVPSPSAGPPRGAGMSFQFCLSDRNGQPVGSVVATTASCGGEPADALRRHISSQVQLINTLVILEQQRLDAERRAAEDRTIANTDALTGTLNRRGWEYAIRQFDFRAFNAAAMVVSIDLDGLKAVNDSIGHAAGDDLIKRAVHAIRAAAGSDSIVACLGGDELDVLIPRPGMRSDCTR
jgi:GGDEF domain-containing protein